MSFSVIVMAGDQQVRIPTMRYNGNDFPVHLYLNIQDGHNLREVDVTVCPESQQVSCEFAMTSNSEISARRDEFHDTKELVARIPIANGSGESSAGAGFANNTRMTEVSSDAIDGDSHRRTRMAQAYPPRRSPRIPPTTTDITLISSTAASVATTTQNNLVHREKSEPNNRCGSSRVRSLPQVAATDRILRSGRRFPAKMASSPFKSSKKMIDRVHGTEKKPVPTYSPRITRSGTQRANASMRRVLRPRNGIWNGVLITDEGLGDAGKENDKRREKTTGIQTLVAGKSSCLRKSR